MSLFICPQPRLTSLNYTLLILGIITIAFLTPLAPVLLISIDRSLTCCSDCFFFQLRKNSSCFVVKIDENYDFSASFLFAISGIKNFS